MKQLISEMIEKEAYKADYENIKSALLFEKVDYATAVNALIYINTKFYS